MKKIVFFLLLLIVSEIWVVNAQNKKNKKKKKKEPVTPVNGKWVPTYIRGPNGRRIPNPALLKSTTPSTVTRNNGNKNQQVNRRPAGNRLDGVITPPLQRYEGEPALQKPSWPHCINNLEIGSNWAVISSPGYPNKISGQLQCSWIFYAARGNKIRLSFDDMDLADSIGTRCGSQFVDIIDYDLQKSQGRFCGTKIPGDYVSKGSILRLDLQADTALEPHRGFQVGIRAEPGTVQSGTRQRSLLYHGTPPPRTTSTTTRKRIRKTTVRTTTTTTTTQLIRSNPNIYTQNNYFGKYNQPNNDQGSLLVQDEGNNSLLAVYILVGIICFLIVMAGVGFVYRRKIKAYLNKWSNGKKWNEKEKEKSQVEYSNEDSQSMRSYQERNFSLPGSQSGSIRESLRIGNGGRRKSIIFEDEYLAAVAATQQQPPYHIQHENIPINYNQFNQSFPPRPMSNAGSFISNHTNLGYHQGYDMEFREPLYEDDTMSVTSFSSVRSSNRHPDHAIVKQKEIAKRRNSIQRTKSQDQNPEPIYCTDNDVAAISNNRDLGNFAIGSNKLRSAKSMSNLNFGQPMHNFPSHSLQRRRSFCM